MKFSFMKNWLHLPFVALLISILLILGWYALRVKGLDDYKSQLYLEMSRGEYFNSINTIDEILKRVNSPEEKWKYYSLLGDIYFYSLKKYQKGIDSYEKALKFAKSESEKKKVYLSLSEVYEAIGDYDKAISFLEKGRSLSNGKREIVKITFKILELYQNQKKFEKALIGLKRLLRENPYLDYRCKILFNIGIIYYMNKNFSSSIEFLKKTISNCEGRYPEISEKAKILLVDCYEFLEDYKKALDILNSISSKYIDGNRRKRKEKELKEKMMLMEKKSGIKSKFRK